MKPLKCLLVLLFAFGLGVFGPPIQGPKTPLTFNSSHTYVLLFTDDKTDSPEYYYALMKIKNGTESQKPNIKILDTREHKSFLRKFKIKDAPALVVVKDKQVKNIVTGKRRSPDIYNAVQPMLQ